MKLYVTFLLFFIVCKLTAQNTETYYNSQRGINKIVNKSFAGLVSGQSTSTDIGNYGSLDPVNGSFTFKGSMPVRKKAGNGITADSGKISYLSVKIEGDVISGTYISLFNNTVLNTNSSVQADYSFWFGKRPIIYRASEENNLELRKRILESARSAKNKLVDIKRMEVQVLKTVDSVKLMVLSKRRQNTDSLFLVVDTLKNKYLNVYPYKYDSLNYFNDSISALTILKTKILSDSLTIKQRFDSLENRLLLDTLLSLRDYERRLIFTDYKKNLYSLESGASAEGFNFKWITLSASIGNKRYFTFDGTQALALQIQKKDYSTFRIGLAFNYYMRDDFERKTSYFNAGLARGRDNNISLLSTQEVIQTRTFKNTAGDTLRQVVKRYNSYTDPITENQYWEFFANYYLLTGERSAGLHLFPTLYLYDGSKSTFNAGIGYVVSFKSSKKDNPVLNAEGYINFIDLFRSLDQSPDFWNRNAIGIRVTLPINLFN